MLSLPESAPLPALAKRKYFSLLKYSEKCKDTLFHFGDDYLRIGEGFYVSTGVSRWVMELWKPWDFGVEGLLLLGFWNGEDNKYQRDWQQNFMESNSEMIHADAKFNNKVIKVLCSEIVQA